MENSCAEREVGGEVLGACWGREVRVWESLW